MEKKSVKNQVIAHFGGPSALAALLGCTPQAVSQWDYVPEGRAFQIEVISGGRFKGSWIKEQQSLERQQKATAHLSTKTITGSSPRAPQP